MITLVPRGNPGGLNRSYMGVHPTITSSPPAAGRSARTRRFAAALLAGWTAFWLGSVIAPCCWSPIAKAQAGQEPAALQYIVQGQACRAQRELSCPNLTEVQPSRAAFAAASFDSARSVTDYAPAATPLFAAPGVEPARHYLGERLPPPLPFHLRTSRLRI